MGAEYTTIQNVGILLASIMARRIIVSQEGAIMIMNVQIHKERYYTILERGRGHDKVRGR